MGFLSNAQDRAKLTNPEEQKKIAWAIREAVSEYVILTGEMMREEAVEEIEDSWWEELVDRLVKRF
jgi:N-acetylmuramoyl-L-alanine amidase